MADPIQVLRTSHDLFAATVAGLDAQQVSAPSYAADWSIADTASHLGSQAEIFDAFLDAGLSGSQPPGGDAFPPIWDRWNGLAPSEQVSASVRANEAFVRRVEALSPEQRSGLAVTLFGMDLDLAGLATVRLSEHAVHTWDVAVALDDAAVIPPDAVDVLVDGVDALLGRAMRAVEGRGVVLVTTEDPARSFALDLAAGTPLDRAADDAFRVTLPGEAFIRLVYGRLDPDHTPIDIEDPDGVLWGLREAVPGF